VIPSSILTRTFINPCLGCEPKAKVATHGVPCVIFLVETTSLIKVNLMNF
jgi:hypothetical protein